MLYSDESSDEHEHTALPEDSVQEVQGDSRRHCSQRPGTADSVTVASLLPIAVAAGERAGRYARYGA